VPLSGPGRARDRTTLENAVSIGCGLIVPFDPPLLYGIGGKLTFPWFSFWRSNPLADARLSLFVTMVDELLADDPDLAAADFQILDFSVPKVKAGRTKPPRQLRIIDARDIPRTNEAGDANRLCRRLFHGSRGVVRFCKS
jgi:hypothetical protein